MTSLVLAIAAFLLSHVIPAYKPLRNALARLLGEKVFLAAYGSLSTVLLIWLFWAFFEAPYVELWGLVDWTRWVPVVIMPIASILAVAGLLSPNPLSISFIPADRYDPDNPGIVALTRHPAIWGLFLWAVSHIPPNGDLAAVLMFALLALLSAYGPISLNMKKRHRLGEAEWTRLTDKAKAAPGSLSGIGWGRIALGVAVYLVILFGHEWVIGVAPIIW